MLHILWMILKFILIIFLILLGVLLLALLLLLFCPVRYEAQGAGDYKEWKKAQASVCVSWLFRGITLRIFLRDGTFSHSIRLLGIPLLSRKPRKKRKRAVSSAKKASKKPEKKEEAVPLPETDSIKTEKPQKEEKIRTEPIFTKIEELPKTEEPRKSGLFFSMRNKVSAFMDKLKKIPEAIRNLLFKLQEFYGTIDYWKQFLDNPRVKEAISFTWQKLKGFLKHIFPTKIQGHIVFGNENPSITGTVLGVLGITMAFHKNCIEINPVFDGSNLFYGHIKLRGRIYGFVIVKTALQIYFNKNIKYVIKQWKYKEESL